MVENYPNQEILLHRIEIKSPLSPRCPLCDERVFKLEKEYSQELVEKLPKQDPVIICENCGLMLKLKKSAFLGKEGSV